MRTLRCPWARRSCRRALARRARTSRGAADRPRSLDRHGGRVLAQRREHGHGARLAYSGEAGEE
eukprot:487894-Prymnesium_polylepis.1